MTRPVIFSAAFLLIVSFLALSSGYLLIVDKPEHSDVILVLAGDGDARYWRGMELLRAGYARRLLLDARADRVLWGHSPVEYAANFLQETAGSMRDQVHVCPLRGDSTSEEAKWIVACLAPFNTHSVLLVTSDHHTRRALSVMRHAMPQYHWSVAAATDQFEFGPQWWRHREWAKMNFIEWQRFVWWELVDRWRS